MKRSYAHLLTFFYFPVYLILFGSDLLAAESADEAIKTIDVVVSYIIDGDSLIATSSDEELEVRLWGIDSPEYDQPGAGESKKTLTRLVLGKKATLKIKYRDRYERHVAVLFCNGLNVNEEMVSTGNSWVYNYYCRERVCQRWATLQDQARISKQGLWKRDNPIPPWQWKANR